MARLDIDRDYLVKTLLDLLQTPSPTGSTDWAISMVEQELEMFGLHCARTNKGALTALIPGIRDDRPRALTAHVDTLGAMVAQIKPSGRLKVTGIGGVMWPAVESEGVTVQTKSGRNIRGSVVLTNGAAHVNKDASSTARTAETLEIRLDERTNNAEETRLLGIEVGDFVVFDPRTEHNESSGFVRSRFLDDKACVACLLAALKALSEAGVTPFQRTTVAFSNFEEVGHGGNDGLPEDLAEYVVLDMAVVGEGQQGSEYQCSICVKDSSGPYSRRLTEKLRSIAERNAIDLVPDVYPYYGSDGSMYWRSGGSAEVALIGPGVDNSHAYERTHVEALVQTATLIAEYLIEE